ncbi:hypothetical protein [Dyella mobilis]|uniref:hypothetical protein n=1 Tax=Dyella mobilis TaxID=1849582 RepID=UPI00235DBF7B|nr:hypothetical protein [Dyella mobilis]GLQ96402.1 hypothetical protein GCM10007863_08200 [Dyella mobilis]
MSHSRQALRDAIAAAVPALHRYCCDNWVVIGSAAAALAGAKVEVADLDLLTSVEDADRLIEAWQEQRDLRYTPAAGDRFRSRFARFRFPGMPVEVMGGLEYQGIRGWQQMQVNEVVQVTCAGVTVPIPTRVEQIRVLESFGRPKDLQRAAALRAL